MTDFSDIPEIADVIPDRETLDGSKVSIESILNVPLVFTGWEIRPSKHKKPGNEQCLTLQFERNGQHYIVFTGSNVLISQIEAYEAARDKEKPRMFKATIRKIDNFYKFGRSEIGNSNENRR